ncbi:hypothetical protein PF005_g27389 [Phytophthora fragariae]|uniref:Helicase-associated domain-containing protein n=1 Tax=Phytophthora fragariae TaxID=53985 RepID=A0A6A3DPL7_9STRA|nr:hypothetical protein PF003_g3612 [Phytophthora fragariae]KAE8921707.1 hypothetical protein PF009_g28019 [Phytophthora fragariae]KAE8973228.1 hypothetical protein PF011_g25337 [Phytophthora fragariae]KAE9068832.1 hypothetical protein PF010_g26905 [Phytophthora fragariae]KAE9069574.1 hypothetical protein PF007_g27264 [Phytophthora fragariae]
MLRVFLASRSSLVRRVQGLPAAKSSAVQCFSESSRPPRIRICRIDLWRARTWVEKVAPSLEVFLATEKHLMVPLKFTVPYGDPKYPVEAWGYPLGMHCRNLRVLKQQDKEMPFFALDDLEALDFPWDMRQHKWEVLVLPSLQKYYEINGHSEVPSTFIVPSDDDRWSKVLWGFRLGQSVTSMRYADTYRAQREASEHELEKIEFSTQRWRERMWDTKIFPALVAFKREFGHCNVNFNFDVPNDPSWPKLTRGMRLGATVANMRCRGNYDDMAERDKDKLKEIGFVWNPEDDRWTYRIMPALEAYCEIYGHGWVPVNFVVPKRKSWPEETRGLRLGNIFMKVRHTGAYSSYVERDSDRLQALGIDFKRRYEPFTMAIGRSGKSDTKPTRGRGRLVKLQRQD